MTVAITGATGQLGRLNHRRAEMRLPADQIIALALQPRKAVGRAYVPARAFDYDRLTRWCRHWRAGQAAADFRHEVGSRAPQHRAVIEAAKAAGVKEIVLYQPFARRHHAAVAGT